MMMTSLPGNSCRKAKQIIMPTHTIRLHRALRAPPERVYRTFLDADALSKWLPPNGFTDQFDDPNLPGQMQTTISLTPVFCGWALNIVQ